MTGTPTGTLKPRPTCGRHCPCTSCKQEDWTQPHLAACGMHGPDCPPVYDPYFPPYAPAFSQPQADTLRPWIQHKEGCALMRLPWRQAADAVCDCGLLAAFAAALAPGGRWLSDEQARQIETALLRAEAYAVDYSEGRINEHVAAPGMAIEVQAALAALREDARKTGPADQGDVGTAPGTPEPATTQAPGGASTTSCAGDHRWLTTETGGWPSR